MSIYNGIGLSKRLEQCINETGMSKKEFANKSEVPLTTLMGHLNVTDVNFKMNTETLFKYANTLNVSMDYLVAGYKKDDVLNTELTAQKVIDAIIILLRTYGAYIADMVHEGENIQNASDICEINITIVDEILAKTINAIQGIMYSENALRELGVYEKLVAEVIDIENLILELDYHDEYKMIRKK